MCTDLGISKSLMTDLKSGRKKGVSAVTAQKIASYFDVTVAHLLGEEDKKEKPDTKSVELNENYFNLSPENKALIDEMIAKLLKSQEG